jgi:hypothetical protein
VKVVQDVLEELWSMFVGDRRLTLLLLAAVASAAAAAVLMPAVRLAASLIMMVGAVAVLADSVFSAARKARR